MNNPTRYDCDMDERMNCTMTKTPTGEYVTYEDYSRLRDEAAMHYNDSDDEIFTTACPRCNGAGEVLDGSGAWQWQDGFGGSATYYPVWLARYAVCPKCNGSQTVKARIVNATTTGE